MELVVQSLLCDLCVSLSPPRKTNPSAIFNAEDAEIRRARRGDLRLLSEPRLGEREVDHDGCVVGDAFFGGFVELL